MTRCRGSELRQVIPEDVQGITLDSRPIECIPLRDCAREERVLALWCVSRNSPELVAVMCPGTRSAGTRDEDGTATRLWTILYIRTKRWFWRRFSRNGHSSFSSIAVTLVLFRSKLHWQWFSCTLCRYIESNEEVFIQRLSEAVAIRSVSGCPEERDEVTKMVQYVAKVWDWVLMPELSFSRSTDVTSTDLVSAKGKTKEVYCCDIVVLIVLFWCFWRVKDCNVVSVYWNIVWWSCETISISWLLFSPLPKLGQLTSIDRENWIINVCARGEIAPVWCMLPVVPT